jgi:Tfp pilus assembly protein PilZ
MAYDGPSLMAQAGSADGDRRRWPRVELQAQVSLSSPSIDDLVTGPLLDISIGGLFIKSRLVKDLGTEVMLRIDVPSEGVQLEARGIVVRAITPDEAAETGRSSGMGIVFTAIDQQSRDILAQLIEAALSANG